MVFETTLSKLKQEFTRREIIGLVLCAILFSFCLKDIINNVSYMMMPAQVIRVSALPSHGNDSVTIVYEGNENELFSSLKTANDEDGDRWNYAEGESGVSWTSIKVPSDGTQMSIRTKVIPRLYFTCLSDRRGGVLKLSFSNGTIITTDCYHDVDESTLLRVFPFAHSSLEIVIKGLLYICCITILSMLFLLLDWVLKHNEISSKIIKCLSGEITWKDFLYCWMFLFAVAVFIYKVVGIPNYLQIGDEAGYWEQLILNNNGKWDVAMLASRFAPRGYWCYIPQSLAHYLGNALHIDASLVWMLIPSAVISWLAVEIIPTMYQTLSEKYASRGAIIPFMLIFVTTWRDSLTGVTTDLFGVVFLFAAFCYIAIFFKSFKWYDAVFAGLCGSIACSFRAASTIGVIAVTVCELWLFLYKRYKTHYNKSVVQVQVQSVSIKKALLNFLLGIATFIIVCLPQLQINIYRGHIDLLPYDHDQAWFGRSVTIWSSDYAMTDGNIAYPVMATDDQMLTMKNSSYVKDVPLNMQQLFDVYLQSPIETVMLIGKKLLIGFDKKTNIGYPVPGPGVPWRNTAGMLFSLWNYFVLFSGIYAFISKRHEFKLQEKIVTAIVLFFLVLPETFMKIEWRYIFAGYIMIYYFFSFYFCDDLLKGKENRQSLFENTNYISSLALFSIVYMTCSFTFLA